MMQDVYKNVPGFGQGSMKSELAAILEAAAVREAQEVQEATAPFEPDPLDEPDPADDETEQVTPYDSAGDPFGNDGDASEW